MGSLLFIPETHEYVVDGVVYPSVTQVIGSVGLSGLDKVNPELLARNANFGKAVHKAIELKCKGKLDINSVHPEIMGHLIQWDKFCSSFNFRSDIQEYLAFSQSLRVGYTIDQIGKINEHSAIVDIKTGTPKASDVIQSCAYGYVYPVDCLILLYLNEDKYRTIEIKGYDRKKGERIFLSALSIYNFKKEKGLL